MTDAPAFERYVLNTTKKGRIVAPGTPLHRLQFVHESPNEPVLVGDLRDVLNALNQPKDETVARLATATAGLKTNDTLFVDAEDVLDLTNRFLTPDATPPVKAKLKA